MFCMYNNGRRLDVKSVSINRLLKYGVCSYTDGQVQSNYNGSNTFGTMKISSRQG